jgi:hypothetical protein
MVAMNRLQYRRENWCRLKFDLELLLIYFSVVKKCRIRLALTPWPYSREMVGLNRHRDIGCSEMFFMGSPIMLWTCIRKMSGLNLVHDTDYPDFMVFLSPSR